MLDLRDKVVVVTGAAQGIGAAVARAVASAGGTVVLTDLQVEAGTRTAEELGEPARFIPQDVTLTADWAKVVDFAVNEFGTIHGLVNNAGIARVEPIEDETVEGFEAVLRTNLIGTFLGIKTAIAPMRRAGGGAIVNISSVAGLVGLALTASYGASKWGVRGLTKIAALELAGSGIRVNSVHPGHTHTPMTEVLGIKPGPGNAPAMPLKRIGLPEEIAAPVAFLLSDAAAYITGAELSVDGGWTAGPSLSSFLNL